MTDLGMSASETAVTLGEILWDRIHNPLTPEQHAVRTVLDYAVIIDKDYEFPNNENLEIVSKALLALGVPKETIDAVRAL